MSEELISREALLVVPHVRKVSEYDETGEYITYFAVPEDDIKNAPAVDAEPVRHGRWETCGIGMTCLVCHKGLVVEQGDADMNYCPNCGAKMDEEATND